MLSEKLASVSFCCEGFTQDPCLLALGALLCDAAVGVGHIPVFAHQRPTRTPLPSKTRTGVLVIPHPCQQCNTYLCALYNCACAGATVGCVFDFVDSLPSTNYWSYSLVGSCCQREAGEGLFVLRVSEI